MSNIRRSFIFSVLSCCFWISVFGLSPASVASQEPEGEVNDISITRTQHDFWESICTLEQEIETCILQQTLRENTGEKRPFSMITIAFLSPVFLRGVWSLSSWMNHLLRA